jgi:hypothetical protein
LPQCANTPRRGISPGTKTSSPSSTEPYATGSPAAGHPPQQTRRPRPPATGAASLRHCPTVPIPSSFYTGRTVVPRPEHAARAARRWSKEASGDGGQLSVSTCG